MGYTTINTGARWVENTLWRPLEYWQQMYMKHPDPQLAFAHSHGAFAGEGHNKIWSFPILSNVPH